MTTERRRSDRLLLTIPLRLHGVDEDEVAFQCDAQTIDVNRHGARIRISRPLRSGQRVRVINLGNLREATFRVAGPLIPLTEKGGEFGVMGPLSLTAEAQYDCGVESLDNKVDLWGIRFPPAAQSQDAEPKALLACRHCQGAELVRLTLIEVDVLETAGIFSRGCPRCKATTPWGYAEGELTGKSPRTKPQGASEPPMRGQASAAELRRHRRVVLQLPILVRDYFGGVEITKSENVSKGGVCFASEKSYQLGEGLMVTCPYDKSSQNIELYARIVSCREIRDAHRKIYGVRYKNKT